MQFIVRWLLLLLAVAIATYSIAAAVSLLLVSKQAVIHCILYSIIIEEVTHIMCLCLLLLLLFVYDCASLLVCLFVSLTHSHAPIYIMITTTCYTNMNK